MDKVSEERNVQVWIRNSSGNYLIVRHIMENPHIMHWEPILISMAEHETIMEAARRGVLETVGLTVTLSMGEELGIADGKDDGFDKLLHTLQFDYQNEELDSFYFSRPEIQSALWASPSQIHELIRSGLWNQTDPLPGQSAAIGPVIPFSRLKRHEMLITIDNAHLLISSMLHREIFPEAQTLSVHLLKEVHQWITKWNLMETDEAAYHLAHAYNQSAHAYYLQKNYDAAEQNYRKVLQVLEQHKWKAKSSFLLRRTANAHGLLELVLTAAGKTEAAKTEKKMRYDILRESSRLEQEERKDRRPWDTIYSLNQNDPSVFDAPYIYAMDDLDESITLHHYHPDNDQAETLTISDYLWNKPVSRLTNLLYSDLNALQIVNIEGTSLKDMIGNPFAECKKLRTINISPLNHSFQMVGNCLMTGDGRRLIAHLPAVPDLVCEVPEGTVVIGRDAFNGCVNLTKVVLPASIRIIEDSAFYHCDRLKEINLPDALSEIGSWAFANCSSLKQIRIPSSVRHIYEFAFSESGLEEACLPRELDLLDSFSFSFCENLTKVDLPVIIHEAGGDVFKGSPVDKQFPQSDDDNFDY